MERSCLNRRLTYFGIYYSYSIVSLKTVNINHRSDRASLR
nr:MAG TPA: hypothetical protein [Bacteriophage sp.]